MGTDSLGRDIHARLLYGARISIYIVGLVVLVDLRTEHGLTFLMVSHDLGVVGHMCRRIAVMKNGAFVERVDIADMRRGAVQHPYTRHLLDSSVGRIRS